jgi:hypothetical protein
MRQAIAKTGKWIISFDQPEGTIDVTEIMPKLQTPEHRATLFRWFAQYHNANCALLMWINPEKQMTVQAEYYAPQVATEPYDEVQ